MKSYIDLDQHTNNAEAVAECVVGRMVKDGILDQSKADEFFDNYGVIVVKRKWYQRILGNADEWAYVCVKMR